MLFLFISFIQKLNVWFQNTKYLYKRYIKYLTQQRLSKLININNEMSWTFTQLYNQYFQRPPKSLNYFL